MGIPIYMDGLWKHMEKHGWFTMEKMKKTINANKLTNP